MRNFSTQEQVSRYRAHPSVNQSTLKQLVMPTQFREESEIMNKGSYLDHILTMEEPVENYFTIADVARPSDTIVEYCNYLHRLLWGNPINPDLSAYVSYLNEIDMLDGYYKNSTREKTVGIFLKNASDWWRFLVESDGKTRLTKEEVSELDLIKSRVMSSPLSMYFTESTKFNVHYQKDFYWDIGNVSCKGLADILIEGNDLMEIDIKYTEAYTLEGWVYVMRKLHYPFQKAFYYDGLELATGKKVRSYWMVLSKNFQHLIEVPRFLIDWGREGYSIEYGKVGGFKSSRIVPGYMTALNLLGKEKVKMPLYIPGEELKNLMFNEQIEE